MVNSCLAIARIGFEEFSLFVAQLPIRTSKTFNNIMTPVRGVFDYALRTGKIKHDITVNILWRKHQAPDPAPPGTRRGESRTCTPERRISSDVAQYFEIAIFAGLRPLEQIALCWHAVDACPP